MRLFYHESIPEVGAIVRLDHRDRRHLFKTLRARPGEQFELIDGCGKRAESTVTADEGLHIDTLEITPEPVVKICIAAAVPRRQKMDQLLRQCTELGVWMIQPLISERSVSIPDKESDDDRWQSLLIESCKQSRNPFIPKVPAAMPLKTFVAAHNWNEAAGYFGHPYPDSVNVPEASSSIRPLNHDRWWIVGPEGGFTDAEVDFLLRTGIHPVSLSPYILRVETAAVIGAAWLHTQNEPKI